MFPSAPVFTLFHFPGSQPPEIEAAEIRTTFLQKLVSPYADYRKLLPLFFMAAETWDLSGFDLVISSSHCVAKSAKRARGAFHLCYCHTPVRYLNDQFDDYFRGRPALVIAAARLARAPLRAWDRATVPRVDAFLANSENVKRRIARLWGREAAVVFPPVNTDFYKPPPPRTPPGCPSRPRASGRSAPASRTGPVRRSDSSTLPTTRCCARATAPPKPS